jgi:crotonobetainyl-CoA:carnitine CoA-transferase CaiB-like acyl-CoA transferase
VLFRLSETPGSIRWAGPRLGEHNREILGALGVTDEQFADLVARGVTSDPA